MSDIQAGRIEVKTSRLETASPLAAGLLFGFQMANMYQYDGVETEPGRRPARLDQELLDQLVAPEGRQLALDPRSSSSRAALRGVGQPPRTVAEMAEWLRRLGDAAAGDLEGPMAGFLEELAAAGRAERLTLPHVAEPERWVLNEEAAAYRSAFLATAVPVDEKQRAGEQILYRYLETHALVGLQEILGRYPFDPDWARRRLEEWDRSGRLVRVKTPATSEPPQWSSPAVYEQIQRGTLAVLRREVVSCPASQFADFVLRWQRVHPDQRGNGQEALVDTLERFETSFHENELWEQTILPARIAGYQPRWLDEVLAGGQWLWVGQGGDERGPGRVAFFGRDQIAELSHDPATDVAADDTTTRVLDVLRQRGALFVPDLAQETGLAPGQVPRRSLVAGSEWPGDERRL